MRICLRRFSPKVGDACIELRRSQVVSSVSPDQSLNTSSRRSVLTAIAGATFVWLFLCALIFFPIWTLVPRTRLPWILLIVSGPPFYAVGNLLAGRLLPQRVDDTVSSRKRAVLRVTIALFAMAIGYLIAMWSARSLGVLD